MTVTQYVGARYVPLFADPIEWSKDTAYEPLTIVIHEGNSYTSRQAVPKGIDIANDEFWALTSNYNAQVESYRKETAKAVEDAGNALSLAQTNEQDIATLDSEMAGTADSGLKSLIEELAAHESCITIENGYDYNSSSYYNLVKIPFEIYPKSKYSLKLATNAAIPGRNYVKWFKEQNLKGLLCNAGLIGPAISENSIISEKDESQHEYWYHLSITNDGEFEITKDTAQTETGESLLNRGFSFSVPIFSPIIENGEDFDTGNIPDTFANKDTIVNGKHPRTVFAWDSDAFYVLLIEGRGTLSRGATYNEISSLCKKLNFKNAVNTDGGHSTQFWTTKPIYNIVYNNSAPYEYGYRSGHIFAFLHFSK